MADFEHTILARIRGKAFSGVLLAGLAAGLLAARQAGGGWLPRGASGVLLALLGGGFGSFAGMLGRLAWLRLRRLSAQGEDYSTEGALVLSAYGAFLGLVAALVAGAADRAHLLAGAGAFAGGALASLLGPGTLLLLDLLVLDGMDDASRARALRRAARGARSALLPPGDGGGPGGP